MIEFTTSERFLNQWGVGSDLFIGAIREGDQCIALIARDGLTDEQATANAQRITAALTEAKQQGPGEAVNVGDWLWGALMDWCKKQGIAPATQDRLFSLVDAARKQFPSAPQVEAKRQTGED